MGTDSGQGMGVLTPVDQASIPFYGRDLIAVRLADGRVCAVLRWLCEGMGLDSNAQLQRIKRKTALRDDLVHVRVMTEYGEAPMAALTLHGLPGWLYGIDETRLAKAEARAAVILFQREATDVLARHFERRPADPPAPPDLVPAEPITKPEAPGEGAPFSAWRAYYQGMLAFIDWQAAIEQWRGSVESRLEGVEEITRLVPEILDRLGPQTLTPEHQATVKASAKRLNELTGIAYATIYGELNEAFHVGKYSDVPESRWLDVAAWLRARIAAAEKRHTS